MRASLLQVRGVLEATYYPEEDYFTVWFESVLVNLETIFAAVAHAGRMMGREYLPELIS